MNHTIVTDGEGTAEVVDDDVIDAELLDDPTVTDVAGTAPRHQYVRQLLLFAGLKDYITEQDAALREALHPEMQPGDTLKGMLDAADPKRTTLGSVAMDTGTETWQVTDPAALLAFVEERFSTEITRTVNPAFLNVLREACKTDGGWVTDGGELLEIPGITCSTAPPKLVVRPDRDKGKVRALVRRALAAGQVNLDTPLALEAGR